MSLLKAAMLERDGANVFLIDGFPREMEQAKIFEENVLIIHYTTTIIHVHMSSVGVPLYKSSLFQVQ